MRRLQHAHLISAPAKSRAAPPPVVGLVNAPIACNNKEVDEQQLLISMTDQAVPTVLSYANLGGQQPRNSRIVLESTEDGIKMIEAPLPNAGMLTMSGGLIVAALGFVVLGLIVFGVSREPSPEHNSVAIIFAATLMFGVPLILGGIGLYIEGNSRRTVSTSIEIRGGMIQVTQPALFRRRWQRTITPLLKIETIGKIPGVSAKYAGMTGSVGVRRSRWPLHRVLFAGRPLAECEWVASELTAAIDHQVVLRPNLKSVQ